MKKVINGRLYDTSTAKELAKYEYSYRSQFDYYSEALYRKKTGEYFIYGYGHADSPYKKRIDHSTWGPGEKITPISWDEAREWAEANLSADSYGEIFDPVVDGRETLSISISADAAETARREASKASKSLSAYIESLIKE